MNHLSWLCFFFSSDTFFAAVHAYIISYISNRSHTSRLWNCRTLHKKCLNQQDRSYFTENIKTDWIKAAFYIRYSRKSNHTMEFLFNFPPTYIQILFFVRVYSRWNFYLIFLLLIFKFSFFVRVHSRHTEYYICRRLCNIIVLQYVHCTYTVWYYGTSSARALYLVRTKAWNIYVSFHRATVWHQLST